jgi:hypothetical protein
MERTSAKLFGFQTRTMQCTTHLVIHPDDAPGRIKDYPNDHDKMVYLTPLTGPGLRRDYGVVHNELKVLLIDCPTFTSIRAQDKSSLEISISSLQRNKRVE